MQFFPLSQIHIVDGELLKREPWREISLLEQFLGIDVITTKDSFFFNSTKGFYCHKMRGCDEGKGRKHPEIKPDLLQQMSDYYTPHNLEFARFMELYSHINGLNFTDRFAWLK